VVKHDESFRRSLSNSSFGDQEKALLNRKWFREKVTVSNAHNSLNWTMNIRSPGGCGKNDLTAKGAEKARSAQSELCLSVIMLTTIRVKLCAPFVPSPRLCGKKIM